MLSRRFGLSCLLRRSTRPSLWLQRHSVRLITTLLPLSQNHATPKAVIFDLGGVVIPSPFPHLADFEVRHDLTKGSISATIRHYGDAGSFAQLERGELSLEKFCAPFSEEYSQLHGVEISSEQMWELAEALGGLKNELKPLKEVREMLENLKKSGVKTAVITNNFRFDSGKTVLPTEPLGVDVMIESCVVGLRKPDPLIYSIALDKLGVKGEEAVFLDDIGSNLKPAQELGIRTIKVDKVEDALQELAATMAGRPYPPGTAAVAKSLQFPVPPLVTYLEKNHNLHDQREPLIRQFQHGQSNPTYYIAHGGEEMVLRKKPPGKLLPSAHAIEREYRVMKAVGDAGVPIPHLFSLCEDESLIGTPFYLMKYTPGQVLKDPSLPSLSPTERRAVYEEMIRVLVAIHKVDIDVAQLSDFGKKGNYVQRQFERWSKQYRASATKTIPAMEELMQWLPAHTPHTDRTSVVHGDFRLDNLIFDPTSSSVKAVLDWELSTLGDPISDLAYCCMAYHLDPDSPSLKGLQGKDLSSLGIPSEQELVSLYCQEMGLTDGIPDWNVYMAFSFFRVAAILQGVYKRSQMKQASSDNAALVGALAEDFANKGWFLAQRYGTSSTQSRNGPTARSYSTQATNSSDAHIGLLTGEVSSFPPRLQELRASLLSFMDTHVYPNEHIFQQHQSSADKWSVHSLMEELKSKAHSQGLWNLFLPLETDSSGCYGAGLTNLEYAHLCEIMGRSVYASEMFNCSPPDTGNMEVLARYGTDNQKSQWLQPLLKGKIRSCFAMTEPAVASSDATNIQSSITQDGDSYVLNGHKWWISGAMDPRCEICIFMGKTDPTAPRHKQQSMILVPMATPGVKVLRPLTVFGYDDAPEGHAEIVFDNVRVPSDNMLLGEGRGFEIAQGRLGPGRIHHCMRLIGMAERAQDLMLSRVQKRVAFGKPLAQNDAILASIAKNRIEIDQARLLVLKAAHMMDTVGNKAARREIAMIKVVAPNMAQRVVDRSMQAHGALGLSSDRPLAQFFAWARILRYADGPDEVHTASIGKHELKNH